VAVLVVAGCDVVGRRDRALQDLRHSLRTVVRAADRHKLATGSYAGFLAPPALAGVTVIVKDLSAHGFAATATHRRHDDLACGIGIGPATPLGLVEGEPGGRQCQ
jgi:hypothetical protein